MHTPTNRTHVIIGAVLAGLQVLNGGAALADAIGPTAFGLFALAVASVQAGWQFYLGGVTTPNGTVAAVEVDHEHLVAGPAARLPNGTRVHVFAEGGPVKGGSP